MPNDKTDGYGEDPFEGTSFEVLNDTSDFEFRSTSTDDEAVDAAADDDLVFTGAGNDTVKGGTGNDIISTGDGDDLISGGGGSNNLSGGAGRDGFVFDAADFGLDGEEELTTISDFDPSEDTLILRGFDKTTLNDFDAYPLASGIMLQLAPNKAVLLQGVMTKEALVDAVDFGVVDDEATPPVVIVELANDTGEADGVTSDTGLSGMVESVAPVTGLFLSVDGGLEIDVSDVLEEDGGFSIPATTLGSLVEGAHQISLRAVNECGSGTSSLDFSYDSQGPVVELSLDAGSDTGEQGDGKTEVGTPIIINGRTEARSAVALGDLIITADDNGDFSVEAGDAVLGDNVFKLVITDLVGNVTEQEFTVVGEQTPQGGPDVTASLTNDTGNDPTDGITMDLGLGGTVSETPTALYLQLGNDDPVEITTFLASDNSFELTQADIEAITGVIAEGDVEFKVFAENSDGETGAQAVIDALFDKTGSDLDLELSPDDDSGIFGDDVTQTVAVTINGIVDGVYKLFFGDTEVEVGDDGSFELPEQELEEGDNTITVIGEDDAGNQTEEDITITLDTKPPTIGALALDPNSDTDEQGDNTTSLRSVTINGEAEVGATISIGGQSFVVGDSGTFSISGVPVDVGDNTLVFVATDAAGNQADSSIDITGTLGDTTAEPPVITLALANDTGLLDDDGITGDPSLTGTIQSTDPITNLFLSVNDAAPVAVADAVNDTGDGFSISREQIEAVAGGPLADGDFDFEVTVQSDSGLNSAAQSVLGVLDSDAPEIGSLALAGSSDTGLRGDGVTALRSVKISGEGEAGAVVSSGEAQTIVSNDGNFSLSGVPVAEGENTIELTITDAAGNSTSASLEVTGIQSVEGQPVLVWNDITLEAIADNADNPPGASRILAMQSVAVYDVVAAIDESQAFLVKAEAGEEANVAAAVAQASFLVLSYAFPAFQKELDAYLAEALDAIPDGEGKDQGIALGTAVAERVIEIRDADGWDDFEPVAGGEEPGEWRETGPMFNPAVDPEHATMDTWALQVQDQFRADAPPSLTSEEYAESLAAVKEIGAADSTTRTDDQTEAARFWKDGLGTETTPGHWNSIATDHMKDGDFGSGDAARALAVLNVSIADAMIAAWDTKYAFTLWRPETAIAEADEDGNPLTQADDDWVPMMISPAHPDYVSGHAAASGAAAQALTDLFGPQEFTTESLGLVGVTRSFDSYWEAAIENAESREWGGIHYDFSNEIGLELGANVADWAIDTFNSTTDTAPPIVIVDVSFGFSSDLPFAITGAALDTLSGVETLIAKTNDEDPVEVTLAEDGTFQVFFAEGTDDGVYEVELTATDAAGLDSATVTSTVVIDTEDPILTLNSLTDGALEGTASRLTGTIDGTGAPIVALAYQIDGGRIFNIAFNQSTGNFDSGLNLSDIGAGSHTVRIVATDAAGNTKVEEIELQLDEALPFLVASLHPAEGADEVGSTFRPEVHFSRPVDPETLTQETFFLNDASGNVLDANVRVSEDGLKAWLFPDEPMPGANVISLQLLGDQIKDVDGTPLDGDNNGIDGGTLSSSFTTVSTTSVPNTTISGFVVDPGDDLKPMTVDDYSAGPDAVDYTDDDVFLTPIEGATVFILGLEHIKVLTDENGYFELTEVPSGNVKIAIDGRTATNAPEGIFWPEMVMDANIEAGKDNTLMASMNTGQERDAVSGRGEVYLPRVSEDILQEVSDTEETEIGMPVAAAQDLTAEQRSQVKLVIQPGSAVDEHGNTVEDPMVGISTVPPELVMDMLPAGLMQHTFDLTIQAPDSAVFTTPAELTLPNVFDAEPGTKLNILSFDHTTGRLVIEGTGTVSADGLTVTTDPGTGITKPGWHGVTPPGTQTNNEPPEVPEEPPTEPPEDDCEPTPVSKIIQDISSVAGTIAECIASLTTGKISAIAKIISQISGCGSDVLKLGGSLLDAWEGFKEDDNDALVINALSAATTAKNKFKELVPGWAKELTDNIAPLKATFDCLKAATNTLATLCQYALKDALCTDRGDGKWWDLWDSVEEAGLRTLCSVLDVANNYVSLANNWIVKAQNTLINFGVEAVCFSVESAINIVQNFFAEDKSPTETPLLQQASFALQSANTFAAISADSNSESDVPTTEEVDQAISNILNTMSGFVGAFEEDEIGANELEAFAEGNPEFSDGFVLEAAAFASNGAAGPLANAYYLVEVDGQDIRGQADENGILDVFLPADATVTLKVYDAARGYYGEASTKTGASGSESKLPPVLLSLAADLVDNDGDLLADVVERVIGTDANQEDTDRDGLSDGFEVENDLDPLSGFITSTGVVDTLPLSGTVEEIAITADISGQDTIAFVASGSAGLSVLDLSERTAPTLLTQYDTPGSAVDVAVDGQLALAAVATGSSIQILDVSTPTDPQLIASIGESVSQIEVDSGRLYAADDGEILVYDLVTGDRLQREDLPSSASDVRAMTMESGLLYVIDNANTLSVFDVVDDVLNLRGTLSLSGQSWANSLRSDKLFASDGVLYVPADAGFNAGYGTIDISDPENMIVMSGPDDRALSGTDFADAGNGIGITVGRLGGVFGTNSVMIVDNSDPTQTDQFVTRFDLEAAPTATVVSAGFVYVGDASGNFHVINALGFDTNGVAPSIEFEPIDIDADPTTEGIQIEEGTDVRLPINLTDDVQIQKVELLVNGEVVRTDLSIPYDLKFRVPNLADGVTQGNFQVRATDTGGNIAVSDPIEFDIIEDITPPEIIRLTPSDGGLTLVDGTTVRVVFNEAIDVSSVSTALATLIDESDAAIEAVSVNILGSDRIVQFDFGTLELGAYDLSVDLTSVTDLAGNPVGGSVISQSLEVVDATAVWTDPSGGDWSDVSKWRDGALPTDTDGVALVLNEDSTVVYRNLETEVERIVLTGTLDVQSGTLQAGLIEGSNGSLQTSGGTLRDTQIDGSSDFSANITGGVWSNVDLLVDGFVGDGTNYVQLYVRDGLTVDGDLELTGGSNRYAYVYLQGDQTVDGSGTIRLNDQRSYLYHVSLDSTVSETAVLGADLSIEGQGQIWTQRSEDWFQILGDVTAVGGQLNIGDIDNAGEALSLDSAGGGFVNVNRVTQDTVFDVAEGADVRITSGTHSDLTLGGAGVTRIQNATVNGLTITGEAEVEGTTANASGYLYVNEDLTVDGTLGIAGTQQRASYTYIRGEQTVDGSGEILLSRANAIGDEGLSGRNILQLQSQFSTERETLTFGEDLTILGDGTVTTNRSEDRIQILGDVAGIEGGALILERLDNAGEVLNVDASDGGVFFRSLVENTVVNGTGEVGLQSNLRMEDVTFNMDAALGSATNYDIAYVEDGLTLNASLELASGTSRYAYLYVNGTQTIDGTGSIDLTRANAPSGSLNNRILLQSQSADAEVLTFGAGIEITGTGRLEANRAEDSLQILGTVIGRDGSLVLTDIDNQGEALTVDASEGAVVLSERIEDTVFEAATGQTGELTIASGAVLDAVTLDIDTAFGGSYPQSYVENGLTLNNDLEISANPNTYAYLYFTGEQVIDGTGTIRLSDENAPLSNSQQNYVYLNGQLSGSEIVTIGADMEITGEGFVRSGNDLDEFLVEGAIVADNGTLRADDIAALEGVLGATSDGDLYLSEGIELTERGTLAVGLSGSGADVSNGLIRVNGALDQMGTLALDIAADFDAELGDEFVILTASSGFTGAFDDFQGFDLAGNKAFELIEKDANTLALRITDDATAEARGFINRAPFVPELRPPFEKTDVILQDGQSRISDANIVGDETTNGNGPSAFENVTFKTDTSVQALSSNRNFTVEQGLELDGVTLTQNGSQQARVSTAYQGTQTVSGTGVIDFVRESGFGQSAQHTLTLTNLSNGEEALTIAEGITLQGHASIGVSQTGVDSIKMLGTLVGVDGSVLTVRDLDNDGAGVSVDASEGSVTIGSWTRDTMFEAVDGTTGALNILNGTSLDGVTFAMDALVDASSAQNRVDVYSGLTLQDATLGLQGFSNLAELEFFGAQNVDGMGTIALTANATGSASNAIRLNGVSSTEEVLTFGEDITLQGTGTISADDAGDAIRILGEVVVDGGPLTLHDIDNGDAALTVNATGGALRLAESVSHTALIAATGNTGFAQLLNGLILKDVELGMDARFEAEFSNQTVTLREGLTLTGSDLTFAGSEFATATLNVVGPQGFDGDGTLLLSDENAIDGRSVRNTINFTGLSSEVEVFTIGADMTLRGTGNIIVSAGDVIDLQGDVIATGGSLSLQGVSDVDGGMSVDASALLNTDRDLSFADSTDLTIAISGAGLDATSGLLNVSGLLRRDGTLNLDIAADFDAEIGTEFEIIRTNGGFNIDGFDAVTGFVIDDTRSIALIESGNSIFARVVATDLGGQQLTRSDLPADPVLPNLNQNYTDQILDAAFVGADAANITGGVWSNVDLLVDGFVGDGTNYVTLSVRDGLTVDGDLELTGGSNRYAYVYLQGDQTVDGSGTIRLNDQRSYLYHVSLDSTVSETVVLGADLSIEGQGQIWTQRSEDWFQILGDVTAIGGQLYIGDIDNAGEALSLDSAGGGFVNVNRVTQDTVFDVAEGADVRITSGTHSDLTLGGAGVTRIQSATVNGLTITGEAEVEGTTANASGYLYVNEDLTVDGTLGIAGTQQRASYTYIRGEQTVDGSGEILLSRANAIGDEGLSGRNILQLQSEFSERETLTFGEDLTILGDGTVTTNRSEDRIQILGDVAGIEGGALILERLDNAGEVLNVDASDGGVFFRSLVENTVVNGTGEVGLQSNLRIEDVTFNMDARIGTPTGYEYVYVDDGLTLNASLELASGTSRQAYLYVNGTQTIDGTGSIDLTRANAPSGSLNNRILLQSQSADAEVLTFGAGIEITGTGQLEANRAEDSLQILGTVIGRDGSLVLTDIDNQGEALTVDASEGAVVLSERIEDTVFEAVTGQTGELTIASGAVLDAVTLDIDTAFGGSYPQSYVENGLTLNNDLEISANPNTYAYLYFTGEQVIDGTGTIRLSDENAPLSNSQQNYVYLNGQLSGSEIVTIGADMEITGEGFVRSGNDLDEFLVEGAIVADNGTLRADDIAALEGVLGATSDGDLYLSEGIELTERGTLAVGLSGSGADVSNGLIRVNGALDQMGTLALDIAADFDAELGDEFVILTASSGFTGAFDDFQGFDLAGNKAFELIEKDANTLALRITDDATAEVFDLTDDFEFGFL